MKKSLVVAVAIVLALAMVLSAVSVALADKPGDPNLGNYKGNGAPSGPHYNLNIIGVADISTKAGVDCGNGHRIFVPLNGKSKIMLTEDDVVPYEFQVLDCVATNDDPAEFMLPNPDVDGEHGDGVTEYSVFLRLRGTPGGKIKMTTCAEDPDTGEVVCSDLQVIEVRETGHGKNKFDNVSKQLLYIYAWVCTERDAGECLAWEYMRLPLFDDLLEGYFWDYDNNGAKIAQLRFYPGVQTTVPEPEDVPHLVAVSPDSGAQGATLDVTITGVKLDEYGTLHSVDLGSGITVNTASVVSATEIAANISIDGAATTGLRDLTVKFQGGNTLTKRDVFEVLEAP